jgi:hypothetical protein
MSLRPARFFVRRTAVSLVLAVAFLTSLTAGDAFHDLSDIDAFAFGGIGAAGIISPGEVAFRELLGKPDALAEFQRLLEKGNLPAKCYALVAIHALDPSGYAAAVTRFEKSNKPVKTIGGCIIGTEPMRSVVANISAGRFDLYAKHSR